MKLSTKTSGQIVGERWGTAFPFRFWQVNAVPLAYTTAVGGRGGTPRRPTPRPLHRQLKSKYGQFFARKPQVLLHSSDSAFSMEEPVRPSAAYVSAQVQRVLVKYSRIAAHKSTRALACRKRHSETAVGSPDEEPQCRRPCVSLSQQDCWHQSLNSKRTPPTISPRSAPSLTVFDPVTEQEVAVLIKKTPAKSCPLDPIPTWLLKQVATSAFDILMLFILFIFTCIAFICC